jgi:hypothetical protein
MATAISTSEYNPGFIANGAQIDIIVGTLVIPINSNNVKVQITPFLAGTTFASASLGGFGTFDPLTGVWDIGAVTANQELQAVFKYTITDSCAFNAGQTFTYELQVDCDSCLDNNTHCINVKGVTCCEVVTCVVPIEEETFSVVFPNTSVDVVEVIDLLREVYVFRNGLRLSDPDDYTVVAPSTILFVEAFGNSTGGIGTETVVVEYIATL